MRLGRELKNKGKRRANLLRGVATTPVDGGTERQIDIELGVSHVLRVKGHGELVVSVDPNGISATEDNFVEMRFMAASRKLTTITVIGSEVSVELEQVT